MEDITGQRYLLTCSPRQAEVIALALKVQGLTVAGQFVDAVTTVSVSSKDQDVGRPAALRIIREVEQSFAGLVAEIPPRRATNPPQPPGAGQTTLTADEAAELRRALETLSRLHLGQLWTMLEANEDVLMLLPHRSKHIETWHDLKDKLAIAASYMIGLPLHASWGIHNQKVDDVARVSWDLEKVIRHRLAWDRKPSGGIAVDFDVPFRTSGEQLARFQSLKTHD